MHYFFSEEFREEHAEERYYMRWPYRLTGRFIVLMIFLFFTPVIAVSFFIKDEKMLMDYYWMACFYAAFPWFLYFFFRGYFDTVSKFHKWADLRNPKK